MTLFQSFPAHPGLMPKPSAQHRLGEKPTSPDDAPVLPDVSQTCRLLLDRLLPAARKARMWDRLVALYGELARDADEDLQRLFGEKFSVAYEEQVARLRDDR